MAFTFGLDLDYAAECGSSAPENAVRSAFNSVLKHLSVAGACGAGIEVVMSCTKYAALCLLAMLGWTSSMQANAHGSKELVQVEFLISSARGGGWDKAARGVGQTLEKTGLGRVIDFVNLTDTYGSRALYVFTSATNRWADTLLVQSSPLLLQSLVFPGQPSWRDIMPVAVVNSAYQAVAVPYGSPYQSIHELLYDLDTNPSAVPVAGSSGHFSLDHLTLAMIASAGGVDPKNLRYVSSDGGGDALNKLVAGQVKAVVGGFGELIGAHDNRQIRILGVTSETPLPGSGIPTFASLGIDVVFRNWRGFFAAPGIPEHHLEHYRTMLAEMAETPEWKLVREKHGWEAMVLTGPEMNEFLVRQELELSRILKKFGIPHSQP